VKVRPRSLSSITDGTSQSDRFPQALEDRYFQVDERSFADLIVRTTEFAKSVRYYQEGSEKENNWHELFASDEAVIMAEIVSTDSARMEAEFTPLLANPVDATGYLLHFALRIDGWYRRLIDMPSGAGAAMGREIEVTVNRKLKAALRDAATALLQSRRAGGAAAAIYDELLYKFHGIWKFSEWRDTTPQVTHRLDHDDEGGRRIFLSAFYSLASATSYLKPLADSELRRSLTSGNHNPAVALFLTFAELFGKANDKANRFTARHRDFYYDEALRIEARDQRLDTTFLLLEIDQGRRPLTIPAGTDFTAGKAGRGEELIYRADTTLTVTDAQVRTLLTLNRRRDPHISPENQLGYVDGLRIANLTEDLVTDDSDNMPSWPLFGVGGSDRAVAPAKEADIGFAIASPILRLREGHREIVVTVSFNIPGDGGSDGPPAHLGEWFRRLILTQPRSEKEEADFVSSIRSLKFDSEKDLLRQDMGYVFYTVLKRAFNVSITTASQWHDIKDYSVTIPERDAADPWRLCFTLTLEPDVPPVTACVPGIHGAGFGSTLPILRFRLNPRAVIYAYSLFYGVTVDSIRIDTKVSDAANVVAWNQYGQLDTFKPCMPFGPLPSTSSYFVVGHYDAAAAPLTRLQIELQWAGLPDTVGGFAPYYRGYGTPYPTEGFLSALSVLRDGRWHPTAKEDGVTAPLFSLGQDLRLADTTVVEMDIPHYFKHMDPSIAESRFRYDNKARGGFFRISLTAPGAAFGHGDYPALLSKTLSENALASKWLRRPAVPLPNPPYTPVLNRITFNYKASTAIEAGPTQSAGQFAEKLYYIHPFGLKAVDPRKPWAMLPVYDYDGNLFIGFSASDLSAPLSLFFHLREDSVTSIAASPEPVAWFYLASDQWHRLDTTRLLSDTTRGFLSSGIVVLDLPDDINRDNTVMPPDLFWLRVSAQSNFSSFCSLYAVKTQALKVTRRLTAQAPAVMAAPLPRGSIKGPLVSIAGLRSVTQPLASDGGQELETKRQKITRSSERLRHKARAVTPWDYERLVLDAFPDVFKVKCFPSLSSEAVITGDKVLPQPGRVLVVVVPHAPKSDSATTFDPMLDATRLDRIHAFLSALSSPHVTLEVRNPSYERLLVRCKVRFNRAYAHHRGLYLNELTQAVIDYISPWSPIGPPPRFGWTLRNDEVSAYIRSLPYIDAVSGLSLLRLSRDETGKYRLDETACPGGIPSITTAGISPRHPWSLAIPNLTHILETLQDGDDDRPEHTGIGKMEVGNSFVMTNFG